MIEIELNAKRRGLKQEALDDELNAMWDGLHSEEALGSTGWFNKGYEPSVRHLMASHGLVEGDAHARRNGTNSYIDDGVIFINGQRFRYEVKSGDGIVAQFPMTETPVFDEDMILPGADLVVYTCEVKELRDEDDVLDNSIVLTRAEFLEFIATEGPKRNKTVKSAVKFGMNSPMARRTKMKDCICLQPTYRKARQDACLSGNYLSLRSFLQDIGRA